MKRNLQNLIQELINRKRIKTTCNKDFFVLNSILGLFIINKLYGPLKDLTANGM